MHIQDILKEIGEAEEIRKLDFPNTVIIWSGPHSFTEVSKKSGGGLYVIVKKGRKPIYVGQTHSYKSRFRSRLHVLRIAACDLSGRGVYLGRIAAPVSKKHSKNLRLDLESVLIRSYLRRGHKLVNRSSIREFIMGPNGATIINRGKLPPQMKRTITIKGNARFELSHIQDLDLIDQSVIHPGSAFEDEDIDEEIRRRGRRRRRMGRRRSPSRRISPPPPRVRRYRPKPHRKKVKPKRRPLFIHKPRTMIPQDRPCICPPLATEFVRWVQSSLNQISGSGLRINGIMYPATRNALRVFQRQRGLPVDGIAGPETEKALISAKSGQRQHVSGQTNTEQEQFLGSLWGYRAKPRKRFTDYSSKRIEVKPRTRYQPSRGINRNSRDYIRWVQLSLNTIMGFNLGVDGIAGLMTRSAIRSFQKRFGLAADGIVGPRTEQALIQNGARPPSASGSPATMPPPAISPSSPPSRPGTARYITIRSSAIINPYIENIINQMEEYFRNANLRVQLTSAIRTPESQLGIIQRAAGRYGLEQKYPSIKTARVNDIESWRPAWDELLNIKKFIVNPPKPVTSQISGRHIGISPHMKGQAIDFSGADLDRIAEVVQTYCQSGGTVSQILIERTNNAVHVGIARRGTCKISVK